MGNPLQRTEDAGVSTYTYNNLNQLATGDWTGTLSAFGWTRTDGLASLTVADGAQTVPATVLDPGEWTAKTLAANAGTNTYTVTRTATDTTTATAETSVVRPADQTAYTHDANGNMLANGGWTYTWNNESRAKRDGRPSWSQRPSGAATSRLAAATRADGLQKLEFVYDFQGRRRVKRVYSRPTTNDAFTLDKTVQFVYDGWLLLAEVTQQSEIANRRCVYLHGLDLSGTPQGAGGIGSMLAVIATRSDSALSSSLLYLYDGNGNVCDLVDPATANSAASCEYSPFGKTLVACGPLAETNPFRFSAKYTDTETGLVYYGYRYYEPGLGRWINRDPVGEKGGANLCASMSNNAIGLTDPCGLTPVLPKEKPVGRCPGTKCGLVSGPTYYDIKRYTTRKGEKRVKMRMRAQFKVQDGYSPGCCEVRQQIKFSGGFPMFGPHPGWNKEGKLDPEKWYEDRDEHGKRYGHREGEYSDLGNGDGYYKGGRLPDPKCGYFHYGSDKMGEPSVIHNITVYRVRIEVYDVCNPSPTGRPLATDSFVIRWLKDDFSGD